MFRSWRSLLLGGCAIHFGYPDLAFSSRCRDGVQLFGNLDPVVISCSEVAKLKEEYTQAQLKDKRGELNAFVLGKSGKWTLRRMFTLRRVKMRRKVS